MTENHLSTLLTLLLGYDDAHFSSTNLSHLLIEFIDLGCVNLVKLIDFSFLYHNMIHLSHNISSCTFELRCLISFYIVPLGCKLGISGAKIFPTS